MHIFKQRGFCFVFDQDSAMVNGHLFSKLRCTLAHIYVISF